MAQLLQNELQQKGIDPSPVPSSQARPAYTPPGPHNRVPDRTQLSMAHPPRAPKHFVSKSPHRRRWPGILASRFIFAGLVIPFISALGRANLTA